MRRRWFLSLVAALSALLLPAAPAAADAADCTGSGVERFGPASLTGAITGATVHEGRAYVVTRGQTPPRIAAYDLATRKVVAQHDIPDGPAAGVPEGAYGVAVSGGKVYFGTYPVPDLYRYDPATGKVEHLYSFGAKGGYVWSLAAAPDGKLYAGTYPDGKVWEYDPATKAVRGFGNLSGGVPERYVRSLDVDGTNIYAGLLDSKKLVAVNRSTGAVKQLVTADTGFAAVSVGRTRVRAAAGNALYDLRTDGTDVRKVDVGASVDSIGLAADYTAYLSSRPNGAVFEYSTGAAPAPLGTPKAQEETRALAVQDNTLVGFSGSGVVWTMDLTTKQTETTSLLDAGLAPGAERPQSILLDTDRGNVWVGGHFAITVHDRTAGTETNVWVPGEPKALVRRGDKVYAAMYPRGEIIELDLRDPAGVPPRSLGYLGHGQQRPWDMEYDPATDKLLVASAPLGTSFTGALSVVDPDTAGDIQVYPDVIRNQSLMSLSLGPGGIVYLGGDVRGGGGATPALTTASVAAFDLATRTVKWTVNPVADHETIQDIKVHNGILYGVYKRTTSWFTLDLATRKVLAKGPLTTYGEIEVHQGKVFAATFDGAGAGFVHQLGPGLAAPQELARNLGNQWYTNPQLAFEPTGWKAWSLVGRDLARLRLDPACAPVTP
jgi:outer membrane protein assembly factor BamB